MTVQQEFTPVRAPRGRVVHATSLTGENRTACGKSRKGWVIALAHVGCLACKRAMFLPVHA